MKEEKPAVYNLRLPEKLKTRLERLAREEKRSLNQQLVLMLEMSLKGEVKEKPALAA